jgi:hypothetical protein
VSWRAPVKINQKTPDDDHLAHAKTVLFAIAQLVFHEPHQWAIKALSSLDVCHGEPKMVDRTDAAFARIPQLVLFRFVCHV